MAGEKIEVTCQVCATIYHSDSEQVGKFLRCRTCGALVAIIGPSPVTPAARAEASRITMPSAKRGLSRKQRFAVAIALLITISVWLVVEVHRTTAESAGSQTSTSIDPQQSQMTQATEGAPAPPVSSVPADPFFTPDQPCSTAESYQRLPNGARISEDAGAAGLGKLAIDNGTDQDATALLQEAGTDETVRWIYIRSNRKAKLGGIGPGRYNLLYSFGYDWDENNDEFRVCPSYHEFGKTLTYAERKEPDGTIFDSISVTLHPVVFGNTKSRIITRDEFFKGRRLKSGLRP